MGANRKIKIGILTAPKIEYEQRAHTFLLKNVRIGIGFHWDRHEDQEFAGELEIRNNPDGTQTAINTIDIEDYLCSVISSEMNANSPMELLKAHAVISRSWAMRAMEHPNHEGYHVCADDHCQRYEGLRRMNERAVQAVRETAGQVLIHVQRDKVQGTKEEICDCRYYKCCGGKSEIWRTCWENIDVPYIQSVECPYCGRVSAKTLRLVLNDYDQDTKDFHDWQVTYTDDELDEIVNARYPGIGHVLALEPLHRGASGRIDSLRVVGSERTEVIGKELNIRYALSRKCLYSSWFDVNHADGRWTLTGHGWGHGAGLCQIGAAEMAEEGFNYEQILAHYYVGTRIGIAAK